MHDKIESVHMPPGIAALPRDERGFPIPWNVFVDKGKPFFTINDSERHMLALSEGRCPLCGIVIPSGDERWFVGGPQSAFHPNGAYNDLPGHLECVEYALQVCPYLASKNYTHRIDTKQAAIATT